MKAEITVDQSKFNATFNRYIEVSSRTFTEAANTKAFYIARAAVRNTHKADKAGIKTSLSQEVRVRRVSARTGQTTDELVPLAALIINKRRGRKGKRGLYGRAMVVAVREMQAARLVSVNYIRSGWIQSIKTLAPLVPNKKGAAASDSGPKQIGKAKGRAIPAANTGHQRISTIINEAYAKRDKKNAFERFGAKGLQSAFDDETASMEQYLKDKMNPDAEAFNRAQR